MIRLVGQDNYSEFLKICRGAPLNGSLILTSYFCSLKDWRYATVWLGEDDLGKAKYALSFTGKLFRIASAVSNKNININKNKNKNININPEELIAFLQLQQPFQIQGSSDLIKKLNLYMQPKMHIYTSVTMTRAINITDTSLKEEFKSIRPAESLFGLYDMISKSYDYFRENVSRDSWLASVATQRRLGCALIYELVRDNTPICSGILTVAPDASYAVVGTIATLPNYRNQGAASSMVRFLCDKAAEMGKPVALDCGDENLANFYSKLGFIVLENWAILE